MVEWIIQYWYAIFGVSGGILYIAWRMRTETDEGQFLRRLLHAFVPEANPKSSRYRPISPRTAWLVGIALVLIILAQLWLFAK